MVPTSREAAAPVAGETCGACETAQRVVGRGRDERREGQRLARNRYPAGGAELVDGRVAGRHRGLDVGRNGEQGADDAVVPVFLRPLHNDHAAGAMRGEDDRAVDCGQGVLQRLDAGVARKLVVLERGDAAGAGKVPLGVGLPVVRDVVAQAGDEEYGRGCCPGSSWGLRVGQVVFPLFSRACCARMRCRSPA